jgi:hypothetical protein
LDILRYYGFYAQLLELAAISRLGDEAGAPAGAVTGWNRATRMLIPRFQRALARRAGAAALLVAGGLILAGCTGATIGDNMPTMAGGLPENAPQRPANPGAYPAVHDQPPPRSQAVLTDEEQRKLEQDLIAARERTAAGKPAGSAKKP